MNKSQMARIVELDRHIRGRTYPNFSRIYNHYGISRRTFVRDVDYLRDTLNAPMEYDKRRRGYYYTDGWILPTPVLLSARVEQAEPTAQCNQPAQYYIEQLEGAPLDTIEEVLAYFSHRRKFKKTVVPNTAVGQRSSPCGFGPPVTSARPMGSNTKWACNAPSP